MHSRIPHDFLYLFPVFGTVAVCKAVLALRLGVVRTLIEPRAGILP